MNGNAGRIGGGKGMALPVASLDRHKRGRASLVRYDGQKVSSFPIPRPTIRVSKRSG